MNIASYRKVLLEKQLTKNYITVLLYDSPARIKYKKVKVKPYWCNVHNESFLYCICGCKEKDLPISFDSDKNRSCISKTVWSNMTDDKSSFNDFCIFESDRQPYIAVR